MMDNVSAHLGAGVAEAAAKRGCHVWRLPTYSPDLSPIELAFAKFNALVRKAAARTREALEQAWPTRRHRSHPRICAAFFAIVAIDW